MASAGSGSASFSDEVAVDAAHRPFFCVFAAVGVLLCYYSVGYARKYATVAAFLLPVRSSRCYTSKSLVLMRL